MPQTPTQQQAALSASGLSTDQQAQVANGTYGAPAAPATPSTPAQPIATPAPLQTPVPATSITPSAAPSLPQPQAATVQQQYFGGVASDLQNAKDALQSSYDKQSTDINSQLDTLKTQQNDALAQEKTLAQPFQTQLEQTQQQALHVNDNFQANQGLADELASLVNQANSQITNATNRFASTASIQAGYSSTLQGITARAGLIQSAMAAYNGQISQAYTQIDRSVAAINADNTDQLNYYNTLLTLNSSKQLDLGNQAKTVAQQKVALLQSNVDEVQKSADAIKQAMLDPTTAQAYAQSGVTLTDTPAQIGQKLSDYAYSKELSAQNNQMATNGFTAVIPGQSAPAGAQVISLTDSKGNAKQYYSTSAKTQVVSLGNGSSRLINSETGQVIASYGSGGAGSSSTTTGASGAPSNVPTAVAPYVNTSHSGVTYADLSTVQGTASQKKAIIDQAQAAGIKVITNKNTALDLTNIEDANAKLDTISKVMAGTDQPNVLSRSLFGLGLTKLATMAQTNPQQAAAGALQGVGLDILKAISGVQGFRGNSEVVQQITDHLPSIYDTNDTAQQKVNYIRALISDRENSILGKAGSNTAAAEPTDNSKGATWARADGTYVSDGTQWVKQ